MNDLRKTLVNDLNDVETALCALEGVSPELSDKTVIRAILRALWHILYYLCRKEGKKE